MTWRSPLRTARSRTSAESFGDLDTFATAPLFQEFEPPANPERSIASVGRPSRWDLSSVNCRAIIVPLVSGISLMRLHALSSFLIIFFLTSTAPVAGQEEIRPLRERIVGGVPTTIDEHPWQVALNVTIQDEIYLCGGSIIADRWVLTAAHCFMSITMPEEVKVKAGATHYLSEGTWLDIERVVIHESYDPDTQKHDVALVRLRTRPRGRVIPLATENLGISVGEPLEVTGWGTTTENGDLAGGLLKASVPYVDNNTCNVPEAYNGIVTGNMMCAGYREGGVDACQGDSGGPLVWRSPDGPVLVGVVSWGIGCARKLKYGVYTRVANYADWAKRVIAGGRN